MGKEYDGTNILSLSRLSGSDMGQGDDIGKQEIYENNFEWSRVVRNLTGTFTDNFCKPWVYKERSDGSIADKLFLYLDAGKPIGPT